MCWESRSKADSRVCSKFMFLNEEVVLADAAVGRREHDYIARPFTLVLLGT